MTREIKYKRQRDEDAFIKKKFDDLLTIWLKEKSGRSLKSFAKQLNPPKTQGEISRWRSTKYTAKPDDHYLDEICHVFKVDRSEFEMQEKDMYSYSTDAVNRYIKDKYFRFIEKFNVDGFSEKTNQHFYNMRMSFHKFLIFINSLHRYDDLFPLWTRIIRCTELDIRNGEQYYNGYERAPYNSLPNAAPSDLPEFQVDKGDDGIKILQDEDIDYLISLYDRVQEFIYNDFKNHNKELAEGALRAEIVKNYSKNSDHYSDELTDEELALIDTNYAQTYDDKRVEKEIKGDEK